MTDHAKNNDGPRWERIKALFAAASGRSGRERDELLDRECAGDPELRNLIDSLLTSQVPGDRHAPPTDAKPMNEPVPKDADQTTAATPITEGPGTKIGPYKILQKIGEGGFGVVFMADQEFPVRRRVALKIIKLGMDTHRVVARFEAERQALAMMDHPNIARVLDAGATDSGRPFFVMELVKGDPVTDYCDRNNLSLTDRLVLFEQICNAVQHAHTKGVMHRDIKPSNVLVHTQDGRPHAKVIDFGIAKATDHRLTDMTLFTEFGLVIGTPAYMSPEQVGAQADIDFRTDVYSLGVLLYELLCGSPPFDPKQLRSAAQAEMRRIICEVDPPKPSTRLSQSTQTLPVVAKHRNTDGRRLGVLVRGDLDWIVMKAMEKDRARRYETANAFSADIRRHLSGEPVAAAPPSVMYRVKKFVRKHRGQVVAASLVTLSIFIGLGATIWQARTAARERDKAKTAEHEQDLARAEAETQRKVAEKEKSAAKFEAYAARLHAATAALSINDVKTARQHLAACPLSFRGWEWRWLDAKSDSSLVLLQGHEGSISSATYSPSGTQILTASQDKTARLWDALSGKPVGEPMRHEGTLDSAIFSPNGTRILTSSWQDRSAWLWDLSGKQVGETMVPEGYVTFAVFSPDGALVLTASQDNTARLWDATTGKQVHATMQHEGWVQSAVFNNDGTRIVTASADSTARIWSAVGKELAVMRGHSGPVLSAVFSPDGSRIVTASFDKCARLWDLSGNQVGETMGHEDRIWSAKFSPDGTRIVTASADKTARVWDNNGKKISVLRGHDNEVYRAVFSPDGLCVGTASFDTTARVWDAATGKERTILRGHERAVNSFEFSPNGERIVTASGDKTVRQWDAETSREIVTLGFPADSASFSPDSRRVATAYSFFCTHAYIWDVDTGAKLAILCGHTGNVLSLSYSTNGSRIVTSSDDATARLWDAVTGEEQSILRGHDGFVHFANFNHDDTRVVTASWDSTARVWDALSGKELFVLRGHQGKIYRAYFSPDDSIILTASADKTARIWDAKNGNELKTLHGHEGEVYRALFSSDGSRIVTASADKTARVWNTANGAVLAVLSGHEGEVYRATFSPDGTRIVTSSPDKTARLWDVAHGNEVAVLRGHDGPLVSAVFSPDGLRILTASHDGTSRIWDGVSGRDLAVLRPPNLGGRASFAGFSPDGQRIMWVCAGPTLPLWSATPYRDRYKLTEESRHAEKHVRPLVEENVRAGVSVENIRDTIAKGLSLNQVEKSAALCVLCEFVDKQISEDLRSARTLNDAAWAATETPGPTPDAVVKAVSDARRAVELHPTDEYLGTLGVAQYRAGQFADALISLARVREMTPRLRGFEEPVNLAFFAMVQYQLGRQDDARGSLGQLRLLLSKGNDKVGELYLREAEALIEGHKSSSSQPTATHPVTTQPVTTLPSTE